MKPYHLKFQKLLDFIFCLPLSKINSIWILIDDLFFLWETYPATKAKYVTLKIASVFKITNFFKNYTFHPTALENKLYAF